jgi:hypothetical protein
MKVLLMILKRMRSLFFKSAHGGKTKKKNDDKGKVWRLLVFTRL